MDVQRLLDKRVDQRVLVRRYGDDRFQFGRFSSHDLRQPRSRRIQQCAIQPDRRRDLHDGDERNAMGGDSDSQQRGHPGDGQLGPDRHRREFNREQRRNADRRDVYRERHERDHDGRLLGDDHDLGHVDGRGELGFVRRGFDPQRDGEHRNDERGGPDRQDPRCVEWIWRADDRRHGLRRIRPHNGGPLDGQRDPGHDCHELLPVHRERTHGQRCHRRPPNERVDRLRCRDREHQQSRRLHYDDGRGLVDRLGRLDECVHLRVVEFCGLDHLQRIVLPNDGLRQPGA